MKALLKSVSLFLIICLCGAARAAPFDGSEALICAAFEMQSCEAGAVCEDQSAEDIDAPLFLKISVRDKRIKGTRPSGAAVDAKIEFVRHSQGQMFLLGAQDKYGWSITIGEMDGKMTLALTDRQSSVSIFGACTQR